MDTSQDRDGHLALSSENGSAEALEKFRKPLVHYLVSGLSEHDKWVRYLATEMLGTIRDPAAIRYLIPLLADADGDVRECAARALDAVGRSHGAFSRLQKSGCDSCLIRIIAQEALITCKTGERINEPAPFQEYHTDRQESLTTGSES